jgi:hypothetical protein
VASEGLADGLAGGGVPPAHLRMILGPEGEYLFIGVEPLGSFGRAFPLDLEAQLADVLREFALDRAIWDRQPSPPSTPPAQLSSAHNVHPLL